MMLSMVANNSAASCFDCSAALDSDDHWLCPACDRADRAWNEGWRNLQVTLAHVGVRMLAIRTAAAREMRRAA
jgi:hypothetical protein